MARYQQGIGTPETLGVQPTMWKDPKLPDFKPRDIPRFNSGASRNYGGLKGGYLDTMQSRWWLGSPTATPSAFPSAIVKNRSQGGAPITAPPTSRTMSRGSTGVVNPAERRNMW